MLVQYKGREAYAMNFLRMRSLGAGYREEDLEKVFSGESAFTPDPKQQRAEGPRRPACHDLSNNVGQTEY